MMPIERAILRSRKSICFKEYQYQYQGNQINRASNFTLKEINDLEEIFEIPFSIFSFASSTSDNM